ncbi:hypothetical protein H0X32_02030 [Patescibacteria group bacterium]|nr:hypothetical protein [Patescibacteria group bacterium]
MKKILLSAVLVLSLPASAFAATYDYVNTSGALQSVVASTPEQALITAPNIALHSGVILDTGTVVVAPTGTMSLYEYVAIDGNLSTVQANSPTQAFALATNIALHSGVMAL